MSENPFITILIAEDNDVSRELMAGVLREQGFKILGAINGESAIKVVEENNVDLAIVDINMQPTGGFEFIRHLVTQSIKIPVVVVTSDGSSDLLMEANSLGVDKVIQKPIYPERLVSTVHRILKREGLNPQPLAVETHQAILSPEELMARAIEIASDNAKSLKGGPFGAVVADKNGKILGIGMNGMSSRVDPTAHAEVMAIRQAADSLGRSDLSDCVLYCSSEPTMMGKSLIISVGIEKVYYGISHQELGQIRKSEKGGEPVYLQLGHDEALEMFQNHESKRKKIED